LHRSQRLWSWLLFAATVGSAPPGQAGGLELSYVETPQVQLIFLRPELDYLMPYALGTFNQSFKMQQQFFNWVPWEKPAVQLRDFSDAGNASAGAVPRNTLRIEIEPDSNAFETNPSQERMASTMNHELVHLATMDVSNAEDRFWRHAFFGKVGASGKNPESLAYSYLTAPRFPVPRWYLEGSAVFFETWMGGGLGRAQGGYDEMVFRAMVRDDSHFFDPLGLESRGTRIDFQTGANAYLYGTRFFTWLANAYSPELVIRWLRRDEDSKRHYSAQFEQVFGITLDEGWRRWIDFEHSFQRDNLKQVRQQPITRQRNLVASPLGSVSRACVDEKSRTLYGAFRYPGVVEHIGALDLNNGRVDRLVDIQGGALYSVTSFVCDLPGKQVFWVNDNFAWRDLMTLDLATGKSKMLLKDARIGELAFNPVDRALWGVRHHDGFATLVRIPFPYEEWNQVHTFPYGTEPSWLDISPDGKLLSASVLDVSGDQDLRVWTTAKLLQGDVTPQNQHTFGQASPEGFVFTPDGRYLYGSSYFTGVSNIFRYEPATDELVAVSNAESGFFRPLPLADGQLVVFSFSGAGFQPALITPTPLEDLSAIRFLGTELTKKYPVVTTWQVALPRGDAAEKSITVAGDYEPLQLLALESAYPVLQGYRNASGAGYHAIYSDPMGYAQLDLTAAYTPIGGVPGNERGHFEARGLYLGWRASASYNRSDFYDLFGPTKRGLAGYAFKGGYTQSLIYEPPKTLEATYDLKYFDQLKTLPDAQNVDVRFKRLLVGEASLRYKDVRRSVGAVDDEKGVIASGTVTATRVRDTIVPQVSGRLDLGMALPVPHASIWSRTVAGYSDGNVNNPVANFYFGSFGNNRVDDGEIQRYREPYSLPGFGIDEISGRTYVRQMVDLSLPPVIFESLGVPDLHLQSLRPAVFASKLWTDFNHSGQRKTYDSIGAQADLRFSVLHWYSSTLSFGYAVGLQPSQRRSNEVMVSLKLL